MNNPFKQALAERRPQIGLWLSLAQAYAAEICASAGFQWLLIDGEHAPNDVRSMLAQLQAVAAYPVQPVVRAVSGETALIKQLLDIGVQNLLVPMVDTPDQARALVAATRYPPQGVRGVGAATARASRWGARRDYLGAANDEICLLVQAESTTALGHL
jgi:4-hydroxy-2-oxoheptanedioate aldolase